MRNYLLNGVAALTMGLAFTSCMKEFTFEEQREQQALNNAEQTLGFHIPEGQDWVMSSQATANVSVNMTSGETYTVKIFSNNPLTSDIAYILAEGEVVNGSVFTSSFRYPSDLNEVYLSFTDSEGYTYYRKASIENGMISYNFAPAASSSSSRTRSITVSGDEYETFNYPTNEELAAAFPTSIPEGADEVADLETLYKGKTVQTQYGETTLWDLNAIYKNVIVEGYNLKVTKSGIVELGGNHQNAGWNGSANVAYTYNVYVDVDGDLTIRRVGATHFNLYILNGNVTLESNYGEQAGIISVASGATLNDQRSSIAANQGIKLFNRGTVNATNTDKYDIGNFSTVYNEGKFKVTGALTYSPGDTNTSYFINMGDDAKLTAKTMTLNSSSNFLNSGKVDIENETAVTQSDNFWVNSGYYTTGSMTFSAKNTTFYNYCQLIVKGNAHMYDGEFNLMQNGYIEANTAEFDNFIVNMKDNSSFYVKGNTSWGAQGDGTFQGFRLAEGATGKNIGVKIDGVSTVASHKYTLCTGEGITFAHGAIKIIKGGNEVTDEYLKSIGDGDYPVLVLNGIDCANDQLTITPSTAGCGASTIVIPGQDTPQIWTYAFEDNTLKGDYDMNDVVLKVSYVNARTKSQLRIRLVAAGCEFDNNVYLNDEPIMFTAPDGTQTSEVHEAFGVSKGVLVNTGYRAVTADVATAIIDTPADFGFQKANFSVVPSGGDSKGQHIRIATSGYPCGIVVPIDWAYPIERKGICDAYATEDGFYSYFAEWAKSADHSVNSDWYNQPRNGYVMK